MGGHFESSFREKHAARILDPARLSFRIDGEIKTIQNCQSLTNFVTTKPAPWEILRGGSIKVKRPQE